MAELYPMALRAWLGGCWAALLSATACSAPERSAASAPTAGVTRLPSLGGRQSVMYQFEVDVSEGVVRQINEPRTALGPESGRGGLRYIPDRETRWSVKVGDVLICAPVAPDVVRGVDSKTQAILWERPWPELVTESSPARAAQSAEFVYLKTRKAIWNVEARTGRLVWTSATSGDAPLFLAGASLHDPVIETERKDGFVRRTTLSVVSLDPATGRVQRRVAIQRFDGWYDDAYAEIVPRADDRVLVRIEFLVHD